MKARDVTACLPDSSLPLTKSVPSVSHCHAMEVNPADNVQNFPIAMLDTAFDQSSFGPQSQCQVKNQLPQVFTRHLARPPKLPHRFERGRLIDIYA